MKRPYMIHNILWLIGSTSIHTTCHVCTRPLPLCSPALEHSALPIHVCSQACARTYSRSHSPPLPDSTSQHPLHPHHGTAP